MTAAHAFLLWQTFEQSAVSPAGPQAGHLDRLWWIFFWACAVIYIIVLAFLAKALKRPRAEAAFDVTLKTWVTGATVATTLILFGLLVTSVAVGRVTSDLPTGQALKINLTGYQWWWKAEYEHADWSRRVTIANELHLPVGQPVTLALTAADVIHSFWIPNLHGKRDLIPGEVNLISFRIDRPGVYRGQCAEFCGLQHAHMALFIVAEPKDVFDRWYTNQVKPAAAPAGQDEARGLQVFTQGSCSLCHGIRGTIAGGHAAPDLTHLKSRALIAAGTMNNGRDQLRQWITNPHSIKPGVRMPPNTLDPTDLEALLAYLETLQ
jgi:cytochrome c oxidase subunit II